MQKSHLLSFPVLFFLFVIRRFSRLRQVFVSVSVTMETNILFVACDWLIATYDRTSLVFSFKWFTQKTNWTHSLIFRTFEHRPKQSYRYVSIRTSILILLLYIFIPVILIHQFRSGKYRGSLRNLFIYNEQEKGL